MPGSLLGDTCLNLHGERLVGGLVVWLQSGLRGRLRKWLGDRLRGGLGDTRLYGCRDSIIGGLRGRHGEGQG